MVKRARDNGGINNHRESRDNTEFTEVYNVLAVTSVKNSAPSVVKRIWDNGGRINHRESRDNTEFTEVYGRFTIAFVVIMTQ